MWWLSQSDLPARYGSISLSRGWGRSLKMQAARSNSLWSTPLVCRSTVRPKSWLISKGSCRNAHTHREEISCNISRHFILSLIASCSRCTTGLCPHYCLSMHAWLVMLAPAHSCKTPWASCAYTSAEWAAASLPLLQQLHCCGPGGTDVVPIRK